MKIDELNNYDCMVNKNFKVLSYNVDNIPIDEQEFTMTAYRDEDKMNVSCSDQIYILKLLKSKLFEVVSVLVNSDGFILQVDGLLSKDSLSIRKKKTVLSDERKTELSQRLNRIRRSKDTT